MEDMRTHGVGLGQSFIQSLVLLPQLSDVLQVLQNDGLNLLVVGSVVSLWWRFMQITSVQLPR